jgi:hypothetical protein
MSPFVDGDGLSYTSGPHGSGQFKAPVEVPLQAAFPQQMGFGGPPSSHMSANGGNIQQLDQHMGQNLERFLKSALSQTVQSTSMTAGVSGGNHKPQATYSSSSRNVEGSDSMNTGMANLSLNDLHPPHPTSFPSDCQIGLKLTDQMSMGSLNPSTSWSPYINAVQQGSHYNPSLAPHMNDPNMVNLFPLPTETPQYGNNPNRLPPPPASTSPLNPPYGNNPNRPPSPPASTSPFNFPPSFSGAPDSNIHNGNLNIRDRSVHRSNVDSFNEKNNTIQDSYNDNSLVDFTGKHSGVFYLICLS